MKGKLSIERIQVPVKGSNFETVPGFRFRVIGNVGDENRSKLDKLGMTPEIGISNCRVKTVVSQEEALALRSALIDQEIVESKK